MPAAFNVSLQLLVDSPPEVNPMKKTRTLPERIREIVVRVCAARKWERADFSTKAGLATPKTLYAAMKKAGTLGWERAIAIADLGGLKGQEREEYAWQWFLERYEGSKPGRVFLRLFDRIQSLGKLSEADLRKLRADVVRTYVEEGER